MMRGYFNLALLILTFHTIQAEEIIWDEVTLGGKKILYPQKILSLIIPEKAVSEEECQSLEEELKKLQKTLDRCKLDPFGTFCGILEKGLRIFAQERGSLVEDIAPGIERRWQISINQKDEETFPFWPKIGNFEDEFLITYNEESFVKKLENFINLDESDKISVVKGQLKTKNKFTACDLKNGKIKVEANFKRKIESPYIPPLALIDFSWDTYNLIVQNKTLFDDEKEPQLVQAALIGFFLGKALDTSHIQDKVLTIKFFFNSFYKTKLGELKLRKFSGREDFQEQIFPPKTSTKDVIIVWSNQ